tara:strand:+ start:5618 stop:6268 length:651 start_codon:yes stop_codon:yes gene_type:complete
MKLFTYLLTVCFSLTAYGNFMQLTFTDVDLDTNGAIKRNLGIGPGLDVDNGISFEYGFDNGFSLIYGTVAASSKISETLDGDSANLLNALVGSSAQSGDNAAIGESYDASILMAKYNFKNALSDKLYFNASVGLGFTSVDVTLSGSAGTESLSFSDSDRVFTYSLGMGLIYSLKENIDLVLNYEFRDAKSLEFTDLGLSDGDIDHTSLDLGLRYAF